jgi:hypothetical protein
MRKTGILCFVLCFGLILATSTVYGDPINQGDSIWLYDREGNTGGGEFGVSKTSGGQELFRTFCLEINEYFTPGIEYKVGSITTAAVNGGSGGRNPDPLSVQTAYLYTMFRIGTLSNYNYTEGTAEHIKDANSLQRAIWYFEDEITEPNSDAQALAWITEANNASWNGIGDVRVINMTDAQGNPKQDQLVLVPEPTTLLLLGSGLIGLALFRRYRRKYNKI